MKDYCIENEGEEAEVEREGFFHCCSEIFDYFQPPNTPLKEGTIMTFVEYLTRPDADFLASIFEKSELKLEGETAEDVFYQFWGMVVVMSFVMGFTMGTFRDCPDLNIRRKLEEVRTRIKEKGLFHYVLEARA